jgi:hypothetical protein
VDPLDEESSEEEEFEFHTMAHAGAGAAPTQLAEWSQLAVESIAWNE